MKTPDFDKAYSFLEMYQKNFEEKDIGIYNSLLDVFVTFEKFEEADQIFDKLTEENQVKPDHYTFNIIIKGCVKAKNLDGALKYFKIMKASEI